MSAIACGRETTDTHRVTAKPSSAAALPAGALPSGQRVELTADQRFLHWMLDHHAELVSVAHQVLARPDSNIVRVEARRLDNSRDAETIEMRALLQAEYSEFYAPSIRQEHTAMIAPYATLPTQSLPPAFRSLLAVHHGEAVRAIDSMVPTLVNPRVKEIAERIRTTRQGDIQLLERRGSPP